MTYFEAPGIISRIQTRSNEDIAKNVIRIVSDITKVPIAAIMGRDRHMYPVQSRQLCMLFIKKHTTLSLVKIGLAMAGRDHSTVIHSIRHIEDIIETEDSVRLLWLRIEALCENAQFTFEEPHVNAG